VRDVVTPEPRYEYSLGLTSQFYFCALPLRLDTQPRCKFACLYCFSKARGGAELGRSDQTADAGRLRRRLQRIEAGRLNGAIDQMLARGAAIHFGGMSDPFGPRAEIRETTQGMITALADHAHATVISTKGLDDAEDGVIDDLQRGRFMVQFSFSTLDDRLAEKLEVGCPPPSRRLRAMAKLTAAGVVVSARLQPLLPRGASREREVIEAVRAAGARHVGVEHLKLPLEKSWAGTNRLSSVLGYDVFAWYRLRHAERVGRELVLPAAERLPTILELRQLAHANGLTFGAADTDLLLLSDGGCCCSGADLHGVGQSFHDYTYVQAVRQSDAEDIRIAALDKSWAPDGSIAQWVNSRSRLPSSAGAGAGLRDYLKRNWNGRSNGPAPAALWGVEATGAFDEDGFRVYELTAEARGQIRPVA
jgi:DNA repair photolyase